MSVDFVAIDFETANGFRGSPCAVGLVKVIGGETVEEWSSLMRPPASASAFDYRNVRIHGIRPADVETAPGFSQVLRTIRDFTGELPLVAHNAAFDMGVLRAAAEASGERLDSHPYACTVQMSRRHFQLPSHALPFSAEAAGAPMTHHHDALHDARACAAVASAVLASTGCGRFEEALASVGVPLSRLEPYDPASGLSKETAQALERVAPAYGDWVDQPAGKEEAVRLEPIPADESADPGNSLYGQRVLFTGPLGLSRQEAWRRAAACGATPVSILSSSTSVLVVGGGFSGRDLRSGGGFTSQTLEKVLRLQSRGLQVEIMTEGEFMQSVGGQWPAHGA